MDEEAQAKAKHFLAAARWLDSSEMQLTVERYSQERNAAEKKLKECMRHWSKERRCYPKTKKCNRETEHTPEEIGSQDEDSEHAREEMFSLHDVVSETDYDYDYDYEWGVSETDSQEYSDAEEVDNVGSDLGIAISELKILQDLRDHEHGQYTENVGIATIRAKWVSQGNENEWDHLWQRAEEPAVQRLLLIAAKAATDLPPVSSDPTTSDPAQPDKSRRL